MKTYELTYIISPDMTSVEAETKSKAIETAIQSNEGVILKQMNPVPKTLSHQVNKHASGFFGVFEFQAEEEKLEDIKKLIGKDEKIVRQMLIIKKPMNMRKARRTKKEPTATAETATAEPMEKESTKEEAPKEESLVKKIVDKAKVELKDIEEQLEDILG